MSLCFKLNSNIFKRTKTSGLAFSITIVIPETYMGWMPALSNYIQYLKTGSLHTST